MIVEYRFGVDERIEARVEMATDDSLMEAWSTASLAGTPVTLEGVAYQITEVSQEISRVEFGRHYVPAMRPVIFTLKAVAA